MHNIDKIALVDAALAGKPVERIPFSVWYHFPPTAIAGKACAEAHLMHYRRYDLDFLKVMNDNPYPMPQAMPVVERSKDWFKLEPWKGDEKGFAGALQCIHELNHYVGKETRHIITVFGPFATAMKISNQRAIEHLRDDPEAFEQGLDAIAQSLAAFSKKAIETGASGVYFAASGAEPTMLTSEEYRRFVKSHDVDALKGAEGAPFNLLHVHGTDVYLDLFMDYPANAINWPSHHSEYPIAKVRKMTDKCIVGGIDERGPISQGKMRATITEVNEALAAGGRAKLMLGPECTVAPETRVDVISGVRDLVAQM